MSKLNREDIEQLYRETRDLQRLVDAQRAGAEEAYWRAVDALPPAQRAEFEVFYGVMVAPPEKPEWLSPGPSDDEVLAAAERLGWR